MKAVYISDLHFGVKKNSDMIFRNQVLFIKNQLVPYLEKNNIKYMFILGDLFDNRNNTNNKIMNIVYMLFKKFLSKYKIYIIVGNHDCYYNSSVNVNSVKYLSALPNVDVVDKITELELYNQKIIMVPWITNHSDFIRDFTNRKCDICLGHFNISGFKFNKYRSSNDGLSANFLGERCKIVFSGHFHIRSKQKFKGCDIIYIGSPYQLTRNDINENRGFVTYDFDTSKYEFIDNETSMKFIKLTFPESFTKEMVKGNIIDIHIPYDDRYEEGKINKYIQRIEKYEPITSPNIFIDNDPSIINDFKLDDCNIGSITELMKEYVNSLEIKNKSEILKIMTDLHDVVKGDF